MRNQKNQKIGDIVDRFPDRKDMLIYMINKMGLNVGVEIGVYLGELSTFMLKILRQSLYMVDPWMYFKKGSFNGAYNCNQRKIDLRYNRVYTKFLNLG